MPENEEPEPLKPPPKKMVGINKEKEDNVLMKWHVWGAAIVAILFIVVYVLIYTPYYYATGIKLNALWSLTNDICTSSLFFIIFHIWNKAKINLIARIIVLIGSLFFAINGLIYIIVWGYCGDSYSHYKLALIGSLVLTIIYLTYYVIRNHKYR